MYFDVYTYPLTYTLITYPYELLLCMDKCEGWLVMDGHPIQGKLQPSGPGLGSTII